MGLLERNNQENSEFVTDCVGKTGFCEYVSDPNSEKLYQNTTLFAEESKGEQTQTQENDVDVDSLSKKIDVLAQSQMHIIKVLEEIKNKL